MALLACIGGLFAAGTEGGRALNGDGSGSWPPPEDNCSFRISSKSFPPKAEKCRKHAGLRYGVRRAKIRAISQSGQRDNRGGKVIFLIFLSVKNTVKIQKSHAAHLPHG